MQNPSPVDNGGMDASHHPVQPPPPAASDGMATDIHPVQEPRSRVNGAMAKTDDGIRARRGPSD